MTIRPDIPPGWFVEALSKLASEIYRNTGQHRPLVSVVVAEGFGYQIGVSPFMPIEVHTAAGYVTVRSMMEPEPFVLPALRDADSERKP